MFMTSYENGSERMHVSKLHNSNNHDVLYLTRSRWVEFVLSDNRSPGTIAAARAISLILESVSHF
jgi:hypothetical protein